MKLSIRGYRRIHAADIEVSPIALIGGLNGEGKTSIIQAAQAALTRQPIVIPGVLVKHAAMLVHDGEDNGRAVLTGEGGEARVVWPDAKVGADETAPKASPVAAGLVSLPDMKDKERAALLATYIDATPAEDDVRRAMADLGFPDNLIGELLKVLAAEGYDATMEKAKAKGQKARGAWEATTGETWGSKKGEGWRPAGWTEDLETATAEELEMDAAKARSDLETAIGAGAVEDAQLSQLREDADTLEHFEEQLRHWTDQLEGFKAILRQWEKDLDNQPADPGDTNLMPCPHCLTILVADPPMKPERLKKAEQVKMKDAEIKALRLKRAELSGAISRGRGDVNRAEREIERAEAGIAKAKAAAEKLEGLDTNGSGDELVTRGRAEVARTADRLKMRIAVSAATVYHAQIIRYSELAKLLAPDGLRERALARAIEGFNGRLGELCHIAKWREVKVEPDLSLTYGGRPFALSSQGEQMRVRIALQLAMAEIDGSAMVAIDAAEALDKHGRNGLFAMLTKTGLSAIVAGVFMARDKVPNLAAARLGRSYWLEGATAQEISA